MRMAMSSAFILFSTDLPAADYSYRASWCGEFELDIELATIYWPITYIVQCIEDYPVGKRAALQGSARRERDLIARASEGAKSDYLSQVISACIL